jgi:NitT/TauT family transport system substrate-binding protein
VVQQVIAGNAPYGMAAATSILIGAQRDSSLRAVFCNPSRNLFGIAVPEGSDIEEIADLEGKTLGISEQGGGETPS